MNQPYAGATNEQLRSPLVRELLAVHDMFRNELAVMVGFITELMDGDLHLSNPETQFRIQRLIQVGSRYTQILHLHHRLETSSMFPVLQEEGLEGSVIDRLNTDHDQIGLLIDQFSAAIHDLSAIEPDVMNNDLRRLADALHDHLAYEETHVCPLLARFSSWPLR
jgi:hemerythrin-like domain-containing protein